MPRHLVTLILMLGALALAGCSGKNYSSDSDNADMRANLEPELWDGAIIKDFKRGRPLTEQEKKALASHGAIQFNLDVTENEEVQGFLQYFSMERRETMERWLKRAEPHLPYVRAVLASYNLPPDLIVLPFIESGYNNMAYSPAGAGGMWQFMPFTGKRFGLTVDWWEDERRNPYKATVAAAKYLTKLHQMFGDWHLALAAYNAGEGKISRVMAQSGQSDFFDIAKNPNLLKQETRHYVPKFLAVLKIFQNLDTLGFRKVNWQAGPDLKELTAPGGTDLLALARACGMTWDQFQEHNAGFRRQVSPPDRPTAVYMPAPVEQKALAFLQNPGAHPAAGYQTFVAQSGDTWWSVARRTGIPVAELRKLNSQVPDSLGPGASLRLPGQGSAKEDAMLAALDGSASPGQGQPGRLIRHQIRKGESIKAVADKYGVSEKAILSANKLKPGTRVTVGRGLLVPLPDKPVETASKTPVPRAPSASTAPPADAHVIQKGDTLGAIASRYGVSTQELMEANANASPKSLIVGKTLVIPGQPGKAGKGQVGVAAKSQPVQPAQPAQVATAPTLGASGGAAYVVKTGDSLFTISQRYAVSPEQIMKANKLASASALRAGQTLTIPGSSGAAGPATPSAPVKIPTPPQMAAKLPNLPVPAAVPAKPEPKLFAAATPAKPEPKPFVAATPAKPEPKAVAAAPQAKPEARVGAVTPPAKTAPAAPAKTPAKTVNYKVGPGETVWAIAKKFNVEPNTLMAQNNLKSASSLQAGAQLTIKQD